MEEITVTPEDVNEPLPEREGIRDNMNKSTIRVKYEWLCIPVTPTPAHLYQDVHDRASRFLTRTLRHNRGEVGLDGEFPIEKLIPLAVQQRVIPN